MDRIKHIVFELILVFSSVLVFRSLWTLLDKIDFFNRVYIHILLLVVGIFLTIYAMYMLIHADK